MDFDIETVSDVLSPIFKMGKQVDIKFLRKKNKERFYNPNSITLKFNNCAINIKGATWTRAKDFVQKTVDAIDKFESSAPYDTEITDTKNQK